MYKLKQLHDIDIEMSLVEHGTPINRAIKNLKLNIDDQLQEVAEILRESNTSMDDDDITVKTSNTIKSKNNNNNKNNKNNDNTNNNNYNNNNNGIHTSIESQRVNPSEAASRRVNNNEETASRRMKEGDEATPPRRVSVDETRTRYKLGTIISKKFDGILYKGKIIRPYNGQYY